MLALNLLEEEPVVGEETVDIVDFAIVGNGGTSFEFVDCAAKFWAGSVAEVGNSFGTRTCGSPFVEQCHEGGIMIVVDGGIADEDIAG